MLPPYLDPSPVLDVCGLKVIWVQKIVQLLQFSLYLTSKNMDIQLIFVQIYRSMLSIKLESSEGESGERNTIDYESEVPAPISEIINF